MGFTFLLIRIPTTFHQLDDTSTSCRDLHDTSRTTRHARHVTHDTITARARGSVLEFSVGNRSLTTSYQLSLMMFMQRRPRVLA